MKNETWTIMMVKSKYSGWKVEEVIGFGNALDRLKELRQQRPDVRYGIASEKEMGKITIIPGVRELKPLKEWRP